MSKPIRAFVGAFYSPSDAVRELLAELQQLDPGVRVVAPSKLHVTLKFLGSTPLEYIENAQRAIQRVTELVAPLTLEIGPIGAFPRIERPSILWLDLRESGNSDSLPLLAELIESEFRRIGFAAEDRPFRPHLTIGRLKSRPTAELSRFIRAHREASLGTWRIDTVELIESVLKPQGAEYKSRDRSRLRGAP